MPWYQINGLDRETGEKRQSTLEASNEAEAVRSVDYAVERVKVTTKPKAPAPRIAPPSKQEIKNFHGLGIIALLLRLCAVLCWFSIIGCCGAFADYGRPSDAGDSLVGIQIGIALFLFCAGVFLYATGELCDAIQEIARKIVNQN